MSARRTDMHRLQRLVRLHREGASVRRACELLRMGRNTARRYLEALDQAGLLDGPVEQLPELDRLKAAVKVHVPEAAPKQEVSTVDLWGRQIEDMAAKGAMPRAIFDRLRLEDQSFDGSYDAVKRLWRRLRRSRAPEEDDVTIPVTSVPGEVAQVDFFYVGKVMDPKEGRDRKCWAFVMLLAHSRHMFVDLVFDQRAETWQRLHTKSFIFFGGVPAVIVPDNLKAAVIQAAFNSHGDIALNRSYEELATFYGFQIDPTPAYAPKKKGKVERAGKYFRDSYIKPRRGQDVVTLRKGLHDWVMQIAGQRLHGTTGRRPLQAFHEDELSALKPCPPLPFSQAIWHRAKVHHDSHLLFRDHLYSVPWIHLKKQAWVRATASDVVVYVDDERVATHRRQDGRGRSTRPGHLPPRREQWGHQSRTYWEERASTLGEEVFTYVLELFENEDALLPLRKVQAIVTFLEDYPPERREAACRRARFFGVTQVRNFKDILRKDLDLQTLPPTLVPLHGELNAPRFARGAMAFSLVGEA